MAAPLPLPLPFSLVPASPSSPSLSHPPLHPPAAPTRRRAVSRVQQLRATRLFSATAAAEQEEKEEEEEKEMPTSPYVDPTTASSRKRRALDTATMVATALSRLRSFHKDPDAHTAENAHSIIKDLQDGLKVIVTQNQANDHPVFEKLAAMVEFAPIAINAKTADTLLVIAKCECERIIAETSARKCVQLEKEIAALRNINCLVCQELIAVVEPITDWIYSGCHCFTNVHRGCAERLTAVIQPRVYDPVDQSSLFLVDNGVLLYVHNRAADDTDFGEDVDYVNILSLLAYRCPQCRKLSYSVRGSSLIHIGAGYFEVFGVPLRYFDDYAINAKEVVVVRSLRKFGTALRAAKRSGQFSVCTTTNEWSNYPDNFNMEIWGCSFEPGSGTNPQFKLTGYNVRQEMDE